MYAARSNCNHFITSQLLTVNQPSKFHQNANDGNVMVLNERSIMIITVLAKLAHTLSET